MLSSFIFFLFLSCQSLNIHSRRILHQPFLPFGSTPPPPPSSTSKYPFSSTTTTSPPPGDAPFFPTFPASPPPPSPSAFASFPVNISSLNLPHAPSPNHTSHTLLILSIIAIVLASIVAVLLIFFYCRRQKLLDDSRTLTSNNSSRLYPNNNVHHARKFRTTTSISTNSSELLYLGTLLNGIEDAAAVSNNSSTHSRFDPRKMDSPELQPLPPLSRETIARNFVESVTEEEEEDFYSPRGSSGGRDSPNGNGSESRRVFATLAAKIIDSNSNSTSSCSSSSSTSNSPARSNSLSVSPPVKSPALEQIQVQPCLSPVRISADPQRLSPVKISADSQRLPNVSNGNVPSPSLSFTWTSPEREEPDHHHHGTREEPDHHHRTTEEPDHHHHRNVQSPSLSPMLVQNPVVLNPNIGSPSLSSPTSSTPPTTPNRALIEKLDASIRNFKDLVRNMGSPLISASTFNASPSKQSPINDLDRKGTSPPSVSSPINDLDRKGTGSPSLSSPASASPERALNENERSPLLSPASSSSSDGPFEKTADESPLLVAFWDYNRSSSFSSSASSSLGRVSGNSPDASPVRLSIALEKPMLTPPPPPPPPPPPKQSRIWEKPLSSISFSKQISRPPPLMPPSMPFMTHNPISISQVQLPTRSECEVVEEEETEEASKPKLKPLHWDKVRASSDREMVWDHLRSSSFKLNEEMIETLFVANTPNSKPKQATPRSVLPSPNQDNRVLDPKKAQNIAISLRALNVTVEEVCEALLEGNADTLGTELLESLLKMAPTKEEERKLKDYKDGSPIKLGPAEKFLKTVLDIPFAFKRVDAMLYIANFESEVEYLKKSFETLETACEELRTSRMFLKLLEAVLKTGNRMNVGTNRGDAHAFKLDTLLKLVDIKGADGKTTLLHFVVQEIIRIEGTRLSNSNQTQNSSLNEDARCRKLGLQVVSGLSSELTNVKKAASMDSEVLHSDVLKLSRGIENIREVLRLNETTGSDDSKDKFSESMKRFMKMAEEDIIRIQAVESVALSLVKEITEYFHGNSTKEEAHPFRIFMVVRDFFTVLERVCKEVGMINERTIVSSAHKFPVPVNPMMQPMLPVPVNPMMSQAFPGFQGRLQYGSGSDDETA